MRYVTDLAHTLIYSLVYLFRPLGSFGFGSIRLSDVPYQKRRVSKHLTEPFIGIGIGRCFPQVRIHLESESL